MNFQNYKKAHKIYRSKEKNAYEYPKMTNWTNGNTLQSLKIVYFYKISIKFRVNNICFYIKSLTKYKTRKIKSLNLSFNICIISIITLKNHCTWH
jgi:hypothetical protein